MAARLKALLRLSPEAIERMLMAAGTPDPGVANGDTPAPAPLAALAAPAPPATPTAPPPAAPPTELSGAGPPPATSLRAEAALTRGLGDAFWPAGDGPLTRMERAGERAGDGSFLSTGDDALALDRWLLRELRAAMTAGATAATLLPTPPPPRDGVEPPEPPPLPPLPPAAAAAAAAAFMLIRVTPTRCCRERESRDAARSKGPATTCCREKETRDAAESPRLPTTCCRAESTSPACRIEVARGLCGSAAAARRWLVSLPAPMEAGARIESLSDSAMDCPVDKEIDQGG